MTGGWSFYPPGWSFRISRLEFLQPGPLLAGIGFDRKNIETYPFFESKNVERKKKVFSKHFFLVIVADKTYLGFVF